MSQSDPLRQKQQAIARELLSYGLDDSLDLSWIVIAAEQGAEGGPGDPEFRKAVTAAIRQLLESGEAYVGDGARNEKDLHFIRDWELSPAQAAARIEAEWAELDRFPKPGDVVWLELTEKGRARGRELEASEARQE